MMELRFQKLNGRKEPRSECSEIRIANFVKVGGWGGGGGGGLQIVTNSFYPVEEWTLWKFTLE